VEDALRDLGFDIKVHARGIMDWDAVLRVTIGVFAAMLGFSVLYAILVNVGAFPIVAAPPSRQATLGIALSTTFIYFIVLIFSIKLKRRWHRDPELYRNRPENLIIGWWCYLGSLPIGIIVSVVVRGEFTYAPFLFALNQAVVGYFVGLYIDRSLDGQPLDWRLPMQQGLFQAITAVLSFWLAPTYHDTAFSMTMQIVICIYIGFEAGGVGLLTGYLFQQYYRRTRVASGTAIGDIRLEARTAL
jgi:hypothetical protein